MGIVIATARVAAALLLVAGGAKLAHPDQTVDAFGLGRGRVWPLLVRALGVAELVLGVTVLAVGGRAAHTAMALLYVSFLAVAARQRRGGRSCGCLGTVSAKVGWTHLSVNTIAGGAAAIAALAAAPGLAAGAVAAPLPTSVALVLTMTGGVLAALVLGPLGELARARELVDGGPA